MAKPYKDQETGKKEQVANMFNSIAHKYDFLNHFLSLGIDKIWRKKAIKMLQPKEPGKILDIATGTGDFAIAALKLNPTEIKGIDISKEMLRIGMIKIIKKNYDHIIELMEGDSEDLKFKDEYFDAITVAFGVRNFENLEKGLSEMYRVLQNNGTAVILEFSKPSRFPVKQLYNFYFRYILPGLGKIISKDRSAYTYLPESVGEFPDGNEFIKILHQIGFSNCSQKRLSFGIATIYYAEK